MRRAALLSFAMSAQTQAAFSCCQCIPVCLHRRAMTIRAAASTCARRGEALFLCGRNAERLAAVAERCREAARSAGHEPAQVPAEVVNPH